MLNENRLSGAIPAELGALTELRALACHENKLSGPLPAAIGSLRNLEHLCARAVARRDASQRDPTRRDATRRDATRGCAAPFPQPRARPARARSLPTLRPVRRDLTGNSLSGKLPASLGSLSNLLSLCVLSERAPRTQRAPRARGDRRRPRMRRPRRRALR
jgi:hypothetical protein